MRGRHSLKFGVDYRAFEGNAFYDFINNGYILYSGDFTSAGAIPMIPGLQGDPNAAAINDFAHERRFFTIRPTPPSRGSATSFSACTPRMISRLPAISP